MKRPNIFRNSKPFQKLQLGREVSKCNFTKDTRLDSKNKVQAALVTRISLCCFKGFSQDILTTLSNIYDEAFCEKY